MADDRDTVARKTRLLDHDRQKYAQTVQTQMHRNADTITALRRDNDKLKADLAASSNSTYRLSDQERASQQQHELEEMQQKLDFERMRQADLDRRIELLRIDTLQSRRSMGGVNVTADNTVLIEKQVRVLENRLDQALVQFNEALAFNRELRLQIDNLRGERKVFNDIYKKLEAELHEKKKLMAEVIEQANRHYEERDKLVQELETIKSKAQEDTKKHDENFAHLEELIQRHKASQQQQQQQALQKAALKQQQQSQRERNETTTEAERSKKSKQQQQEEAAAAAASRDAANREGGEGDLLEIVDHLKEATGVQDLDVLYHKFVKAEEHNFSMYNFVNELNAEVETLDGEITVLKEQLAHEKGDVERRQLLKSLENELAATEEQHHNMEERTAKYREYIDVVRKIAKDIFDKIGCSTDMADEQLGTHDCTESNVADFLGIIEHRTNELLFAYNLSTASDQRKRQAAAEEDARKRKERRAAERQAHIDAGEPVPDDEDNYDDDAVDVAADDHSADHLARAKFVGVGPTTAPGQSTAAVLVKEFNLPSSQTDATAGDKEKAEDDLDDGDHIVDHHHLRAGADKRNQTRLVTNRGRKPAKK